MCIVYDASVNKFVPQDLATYVENTPSFENKIREVAGTAELVVEDGSAVIAKVNVYDDSTYLPLTGNNAGDQAFATDTNILYIWDGSAWQQAGTTNSDDLTEGSTNLFYTDARVNTYLSSNGYDTATNIIASITDSAPATLDTLNELAAALGDDPNFATTVTNSIADKLPLSGGTLTGQLIGTNARFDNTATTPVRVHINNSGTNDYGLIYADTATAYKNLVINPNGGNVGIGNNAPDQKLVVGDDSTYNTIKIEGIDANLAASLKFKHHGGGGRTGVTPEWNISRGSDQTSFNNGVTAGNALVGGLAFWNNTVGGGNVDAMRLKDNGDAIFGYNVGIGTSTPEQNLHIKRASGSDTAGQGHIILDVADDGGPAYALRMGDTADDGDFHIDRRHSGTWYPSLSIERENGNVGIGTTSPSSLLHLHGNTNTWTTSPTIIMSSSSTLGANIRNWRIGPADTSYGNFHIGVSDTQGGIVDSTAEAQAFTITYNKNVGIGTGTPDEKLSIEGSAANIKLYNNGGNGTSLIMLDTSWQGGINMYQGNLNFKTGGQTTRWTIETGGNLVPATNDAVDIGSTTAVVRNIYTGDLHLSNENKTEGNSVDGTKGNWTIQEGEEDLFIINNKTGKKYAFALREIE